MPARRGASTTSVWTFVAPGALVVAVVVVGVVLAGAFRRPTSAPSSPSTPVTLVSSTGTGTVIPPTSYVVKTGDTLSAIAARLGIDIAAIIALNPKLDPQRLHPGDVLALP